ncbi:MAG: PQQ-binding-like beta-propeller repeat protein [Acidobacteria bacterium]|nr:PQQ-binding-like beta-propeller repeat protein [Acidobacteriota bacterium]
MRSSLGLLLLLAACSPPAPNPSAGPATQWPAYGGDAGGTRYSSLADITPANVADLEIAWIHHTGDVSEGGPNAPARNKSSFQSTPLLLDGTLYVVTAFSRVLALDPETGIEKWAFDPHLDLGVRYSEIAARGLAAWLDPDRAPGEPCSRRLYIADRGARLHAIDAADGKLCADFGDGGHINLARGIEPYIPADYGVTSPPAVLGDKVIVGSAIGDNQRVEEAAGTVRAFDARTGAPAWSWDPVPRDPDAAQAQGWRSDQAARNGAGNAWSILSVDEERDLVFVPTGSISPDFFGGERLGDNRWADSVVALRGSTGELVWGFQTVHHDLWDYDVASQPALVDGPGGAPAVAVAAKTGLLFLLDRETGKPLWPVEERPVPVSDVPGEQSSPTQPFPVKPPPLSQHALAPEDVFGLTPWDAEACRETLQGLRYEGIFTPPGLGGTLIFPGNAGGTNWGSTAFDPARKLLFVNTSNVPHVVQLIPRDQMDAVRKQHPDREISAQTGTPYGMMRYALLSPLGVPCNPTPWGQIHAIDLETGAIRWQTNLGTTRDLAPMSIAMPWGTPNMGGPIATAGGLVFIGAAMDDYLRAFDAETGAELWKGRLPAGGQATPMTYRARENGKQYVVIAAGGHGKMGTKLGDALVAFALP